MDSKPELRRTAAAATIRRASASDDAGTTPAPASRTAAAS
jgi:hypothetical protein